MKGKVTMVAEQMAVPSVQEEYQELVAALERLQARRNELDPQVLARAEAAAKKEFLDLGVEATVSPTKENLAAAADAKVAWERAVEAVVRRGDEVRSLDEAIEKIQATASRIRAAEREARVAAAQAALKAKMAKDKAAFTEMFRDALVVASLAGNRAWPENAGSMVAQYGGLDLQAICREAQGIANGIRNGTTEGKVA